MQEKENTIKEIEFITFLLGEEEYGIDVLKIMEIIRPAKVTRMPNASPFVEGVINLRGMVIPIIDLKLRFKIGSIDKNNPGMRIIIINVGNEHIGVEVDMVKEVTRITADDIDNAPDVTDVSLDQRFVSGIAKKDERLIVLLDTDKIFSETEKEELHNIK